jgi:hypothetical protein
MKKAKVFVLFGVLVIACSSFWLGHHWTQVLEHFFPPPFISDDIDAKDRREANFLAIADYWKEYLKAKDGYIDNDPYRGMLSSNSHISFDALRDVRFVPYLPIRLNTDLAQNPRYVVFSYCPSELGDDAEWKYYADGTWTKVILANRSRVDAATPDGDTWVRDFPKTGFPNWRSVEERDMWVAKNMNRLRWDEQLREYVVTTQPAH